MGVFVTVSLSQTAALLGSKISDAPWLYLFWGTSRHSHRQCTGTPFTISHPPSPSGLADDRESGRCKVSARGGCGVRFPLTGAAEPLARSCPAEPLLWSSARCLLALFGFLLLCCVEFSICRWSASHFVIVHLENNAVINHNTRTDCFACPQLQTYLRPTLGAGCAPLSGISSHPLAASSLC